VRKTGGPLLYNLSRTTGAENIMKKVGRQTFPELAALGSSYAAFGDMAEKARPRGTRPPFS